VSAKTEPFAQWSWLVNRIVFQGMRGFKGSMAAVLLAMVSVHACASDDDVDLPGILINETHTFAGRDFYASFTALWPTYDPDGQYTLAIVERPSVKTASQITIKYAGRSVYQHFISNQTDFNRKAAEIAVKQVSRAVGAMRPDVQEVMEKLFPDPDMAPDELRLY
jgi:curli production assembly/transport component CsgE